MWRAWVFAASALISFQDNSIEARWISDLAHELIERREQAAGNLLKAGPAALPAIRKALDQGLPANDPNARTVLLNLERTIGESVLDAKRRARELNLVTLEDGLRSLGDVAADIERQTNYRFRAKVDAALPVRVGGRDRPTREVLDSIEEQLGVTIALREKVKWGRHEIKPGRLARPRRIHLPGATYNVRRGAPVVHGKLEGWVLEADLEGEPDARLDSTEVVGSDSKSLPLERCRWCSPRRMFVQTRSKESVRIRLRGSVFWNSEYELNVDAVERPQLFRVGRYEIHYEFLKTRFEPSGPGEEEKRAHLSISFQDKSGGWFTTSHTLGSGRRVSKSHPDWCTEPEEPEGSVDSETPASSSDWNEDKKATPATIRAARILFSKPVREPFDREIELPPSD